MSDRLLKESEVLREAESLLISDETRHLNDLEYGNNQALYHVIDRIEDLPSADIPQGDVDAVAILMREMHNLEQGYITIGEFDERIEPLRHLCYGRPKGKWELECDGEGECDNLYRCPFCGNRVGREAYDKPKFCDECGADLKGADNDCI